jgi:hypothetical protein
MGKNWARLMLLAWFLLGCIESLVRTSRPIPVQVPASIKIVGIVLTTLRAFSFVILFTHSANDWFRRTSTERSPLFLSSCCNQAVALKNLNLRV